MNSEKLNAKILIRDTGTTLHKAKAHEQDTMPSRCLLLRQHFNIVNFRGPLSAAAREEQCAVCASVIAPPPLIGPNADIFGCPECMTSWRRACAQSTSTHECDWDDF
eukprot:9372647-Pyramimonas_sp.AAC.1